MGYTIAEETTGVDYRWYVGGTLSYNTESRMPEALQVVRPRTGIFTKKAKTSGRKFVVKGGYLKKGNAKRCLVMAGKIFRKKANIASAAGTRAVPLTRTV